VLGRPQLKARVRRIDGALALYGREGMILALFALLIQVQQGPNRDAVLLSCAQLFGPRVEAPALFEINRFYVLRVEFGKDDQLAESAIEPWFYYRDTHPDWEEPDDFEWLSKPQHDEMLAKLNTLRLFGKLVRPHQGPVFVTNLTGPITDQYEHATITRGRVADIRRGENAPTLYRYIRVRYKPAK
jgi:hypothetical protein